LGGTFDVDNNGEIFKLEPSGFNSLSFGRVARTGLTESDLQNDLDVSGSPLGGGSLSNKEAAFSISIIDASGSPTSELNVGEEFILRVLVDDDRAGPTASQTGVFSAYVDVNYNSSLATPVGSIQHASSYNTATSGTLSPGLIDEVGGIGGIDPLGPDNREVFRVRMRASQEGTLVFETNMADQVPNHDVLLYGQSAAVDPLRITFGKATVNVIDNSPKAPDLAAFAQGLTDAGVVFYGAAWCPHCTDQKELFEDGQAFLPFVEVTNPDKSPNQIGTDNNITTYPTWVFPDGTRLTGTQTLETLSQRSGVAIPEGRDPIIIGLDDVEVLGGSPLALPLDGYDPNNGPLTYTVTSDNPDLVSPELLSGNRSMTIDVSGYGQMTFQLYDNYAPRVTEQIAGLAEDGFYDGLTFHRIINGFVIQGGDPLGNGTGGSDLPDFDDQFHVDLQHNQTGILSMAKSNDDTNNSQFFITEGDTRNLDFNHSIFGQLIEGEKNREAVSNVPVVSERPNPSVIMNSVTVFEDTENALVMLKAPEGASGTANLTVMARDAEGHVYTQTIQVNVTPDTIDGGPFLNEIPEVSTAVNTPVTFTVTATDVEGDDVFFDAQAAGDEDYDLTIDSDTGEITITPPTDFVGELIANVGVRAVEQSDTGDAWDTQQFTVTVLPSAPTVDLLATSDTGISDTDNITSAESLQFEVSNVQSGALVEIFANGVLIGAGTATDTSVIVTTDKLADLGNTSYLITATQTVSQLESEESASFTLSYLKLDLDDFTSTPPTTGAVDELISYDADHPDEGRNTFVYSLVGAPAGASIDPESGEFTWTPTASQSGVNNFQIVASDSAGNSATQDVSINVESDALVNYRLEVTDLNGTAIDAIPVGEKFLIRALVEDARPAVSGESLFFFSA
ncbi:MAG: peptidylprolyl isomerase, partial [Planctomycetales bacterium]|nr:peptidylprolyl isomerase [Planctomycetales bacterium]